VKKYSTWIIVGVIVLAVWYYVSQNQGSAGSSGGGPSGLELLTNGGRLT
jgi:hypothetical protein